MCLVAAPSHALVGKLRPTWPKLAEVPWVVPPPWASSRIKLDQLFYKDGIDPPADLIESASFLTALTFIQQRGAIAFWARSVAQHFEAQGLVRILNVPVPVDLPPVGLITMRARLRAPAAEQLIECLRQASKSQRVR